MRLEEYILKRKTEDGINEFNLEKRLENTKICVNYIFEYFNNYLETTAGEERTVLHDQKIEKYAHLVEDYSDDIQDWLIDLYSSYGKYLSVMDLLDVHDVEICNLGFEMPVYGKGAECNSCKNRKYQEFYLAAIQDIKKKIDKSCG